MKPRIHNTYPEFRQIVLYDDLTFAILAISSNMPVRVILMEVVVFRTVKLYNL